MFLLLSPGSECTKSLSVSFALVFTELLDPFVSALNRSNPQYLNCASSFVNGYCETNNRD